MRKLIVCLLFFTTFYTNASTPKREIRGAWLTVAWQLDWPRTLARDTASMAKQKRELVEIVDRLQFLNFNTLFLQVRLRSDLIYPSKIERFSSMISGKDGQSPGYDPLQFAIEECHKRGIECHAWLVTIPLGNDRQLKSRGKQSIIATRPELCKRIKNEWFLDPGIPATAGYISSITSEIVKNYDIDGIHLDYIRYPEIGVFPDKKTKELYGKGQELTNWRRSNINKIVFAVYDSTKAIKPWVQVSAAVIGKYNDLENQSSFGWNSYAKVFQDPKAWNEAHKIDFIAPMMYFSESTVEPFLANWVKIMAPKPVVVGLGAYKLTEKDWPLSILRNEVEFSQKISCGGQLYFRTEQIMRNSKKCADWLKSASYLYPALMPTLTWLDKPCPIQPTILSIAQKENSVVFEWEPQNGITELYYNIYFDKNEQIDVSKAENLVACRIKGNKFVLEIPDDYVGDYYFAVTANDKFHNESQISTPQKVIFTHKNSSEN